MSSWWGMGKYSLKVAPKATVTFRALFFIAARRRKCKKNMYNIAITKRHFKVVLGNVRLNSTNIFLSSRYSETKAPTFSSIKNYRIHPLTVLLKENGKRAPKATGRLRSLFWATKEAVATCCINKHKLFCFLNVSCLSWTT